MNNYGNMHIHRMFQGVVQGKNERLIPYFNFF